MPETSVETEIHHAMSRLTSAEARAARALLSDYPTLGLAPVAEFAGQSHTSAATVLRFVAQLGFASYPDFQKRLRDELSERIKSPLDRPHSEMDGTGQGFLPRYLGRLRGNLDEIGRLPEAEFEAFAREIATARAVHLIGGRFTDAIAAYTAAHLRILRPGIRKLEDRAPNRVDQLLDIGPRDAVVILDMRRYDEELVWFARAAQARRAKVLLITDTWISPAARHARHVLACKTDIGATWDANTGLFAVAEALVARVTELLWDSAEARVEAKERIQGERPR